MLKLQHAIGFQQDVKNSFLPVTLTHVVLIVGTHAALQNLTTQEMTFLPTGVENASLGSIQAMALDSSKRRLVICRGGGIGGATRGNIGQMIVYQLVVTLQEKEHLTIERMSVHIACTIQHPSFTVFTAVAFSNDSVLLSCSTRGEEDEQLSGEIFVWDWKRQREIASVKVRTLVSKICFNPIDKMLLSTSGSNHIRVWKIIDHTLKIIKMAMDGNHLGLGFVDHIWTKLYLIAVTDRNDIHFIKEGEVVFAFSNLKKVYCIVSFKNNVIIGGQEGRITTFTTSLKQVTKDTTLSVCTDDIHSMDLSKTILTCCTRYGVGTLPVLNSTCIENNTLSFYNYNACSITTVVCSPINPLLISVDVLNTYDSSLSVWNYTTMERVCTLSYSNSLPPLHVDIHPSGHTLLVTFSSRLRVYYLLYDSIQLLSETNIVRASQAKFSRGGNLHAAVCQKHLLIFSTFGNINRPLECHCSGNITCCEWSYDDLSLFTADTSGTISRWDMTSARGNDEQNIRTSKEFILPHGTCTAVAVSCQHLIAAYTINNTTRLFYWKDHERHFGNTSYCHETIDILSVHGTITDLKMDENEQIFAATTRGSILVYASVGGHLQMQAVHPLHDGAITSLALYSTGIVSSGIDGSIFLSNNSMETLPLLSTNVVLVSCTYLIENQLETNALTCKIDQLESKGTLDLLTLEKKTNMVLVKVQDQLEKSQSGRISDCCTLTEKIDRLSKKSKETIESLSKTHTSDLLLNLSHFQDNMKKNQVEMKELYSHINELQDNIIDNGYEAEEEQSCLKEQMTQELNIILMKHKKEKEIHLKEKKEMERTYLCTLAQEEGDSSHQLGTLQGKNTLQHTNNEKNEKTNMGQMALLQQQINVLKETIEEKDILLHTVKNMAKNDTDLVEKLGVRKNELEREVEAEKKRTADLLQQCTDYAQNISDLKHSVLISKQQVMIVQGRIEPQEEENTRLNNQLIDVRMENQEYELKFDCSENERKEKLKKMIFLDKKVRKAEKHSTYLHSILSSCALQLDDLLALPCLLPHGDTRLVRGHVKELGEFIKRQVSATDFAESREEHVRVVHELLRQKSTMSSSMKSLQRRLLREQGTKEAIVRKTSTKSSHMIEEMNQLRHQNHTLLLQIQKSVPVSIPRPSGTISKSGAEALKRRPQSATLRKILRPRSAIGPSRNILNQELPLPTGSGVMRPKSALMHRTIKKGRT